MRFYILVVLAAIIQVAFGQQWQVGTMGKYTTLISVYASAPNTVYSAVMDNAKGTGLSVSSDYAASDNFYGPIGGFNMDVAFTSNGQVGCVVGLGGIYLGGNPADGGYTKVDGYRAVTQNIESFGTESFGAVGQFSAGRDSYNGVLVSNDAGKSWNAFDIGVDSTHYYARYGAFPSSDTWFVTSGMWPSSSSKEEGVLSSRLSVSVGEDKLPKYTYAAPMKRLRGADNETGWYGGISRTTDGGKTWTQVFDTDQFYFNQIHCADASNCMAVGENDDGAYAVGTSDGGNTWKTILTAPAGMSLVAVRMVSATEAWVSGGTQQRGSLVGYYYHTTDGGATFTSSTANGYSFDMSFNGGIGYSAYLTQSYCSVAVYK